MTRIGNLGERRLNPLPVRPGILGGLHLPDLADKQWDAQPIFKFLDLLTNGTGGHAQLVCGNRKTPASHRGIKDNQRPEWWKSAHKIEIL